MKVAYICHQSRLNYEQAWFCRLPVEQMRFITGDDIRQSGLPGSVKYIKVPFKARGWQNRFFAQTAKLVRYSDFEKYIDDVDVVIVLEVFSSLSRQFVEYAKRTGKPVAVLVYELIAEHPIYKLPPYRANTKYVINNADHFITVSRAAARHLKKLGAPAGKVTTIYPGVDLSVFKPKPSRPKQPGMIFVGRLEPHKGIDTAIKVYRRLLDEFPDLGFTVVGAGSRQSEVLKLAKSNKGVSFLGQVPNSKLPGYLNRNQIYILPSIDSHRLGQRIGSEQFGFSAVEAMACGLAVITSDSGALPEIVTEKNKVCRQGDAEAFYQSARELLSDGPKLEALGRYNRRLAEDRYDIDKQSAALVSELSAIIGARG
jgi:glycosyltransferase involved in cell wall biosynthesis